MKLVEGLAGLKNGVTCVLSSYPGLFAPIPSSGCRRFVALADALIVPWSCIGFSAFMTPGIMFCCIPMCCCCCCIVFIPPMPLLLLYFPKKLPSLGWPLFDFIRRGLEAFILSWPRSTDVLLVMLFQLKASPALLFSPRLLARCITGLEEGPIKGDCKELKQANLFWS